MKRLASFAVALLLMASPATAQQDLLDACAPGQLTISTSPGLPTGVSIPQGIEDQFSFLCGQVANALSTIQPSIGIAFSGGAHTLGTASTIGRRLGLFPRISITARVNGAFADAPNILGSNFLPNVTDGSTIPGVPTGSLPIAALQGDVVIGLFNGMSFGPAIGGLGAVDLLGSVSFIPAVAPIDSIVGLEKSIINIGVGARIGILKQGLLVPGLSVSAMYRHMGDVTFGDMENPDPAAFTTDLSVISLRAGISKGLLLLDLAAGAGYDIYSSNTQFNWSLTYNCPASTCVTAQTLELAPSEPVSGKLKNAAWNVHANVGLNLLLLKVVGEVGYQKTTDILDASSLQQAGLPNQPLTAGDALKGGRLFASLGLRLTI